MVSAKTMVEIADQNISNPNIDSIDKVVQEQAKQGKFFAKLWEGKPTSMDTQLIFMERYDVEAYNHLIRLGYVITTTKDAHDIVRLYVGWGFETSTSLKLAIKSAEE